MSLSIRNSTSPSINLAPSAAAAPTTKPSLGQVIYNHLPSESQVRSALVKTIGFGTPIVCAGAAIAFGLPAAETIGLVAAGIVGGAFGAGIAHLGLGGSISLLG